MPVSAYVHSVHINLRKGPLSLQMFCEGILREIQLGGEIGDRTLSFTTASVKFCLVVQNLRDNTVSRGAQNGE